MKAGLWIASFVVFLAISETVGAADPALTIYNQNFAVVRETIPLDLRPGINTICFSETTAHLEPDSVILRDPTGRQPLRIVEQNFRGDPVSQGLLLSLYEGKTIDFLVHPDKTVSGRIVRSGYVPHYSAMSRYGQQYAQRQGQRASGSEGQGEPIVEVDGQLRFGLPGQPLFPELTDETILQPTLNWLIETDRTGKLDAELAYVTGGMSWEADYNIVAPEKGDTLDLVGWVTVDNQSGRTFREARIKLIAGDVNKIRPGEERDPRLGRGGREVFYAYGLAPAVTEKPFDEYHLYTLSRTATVRDRETKQIEFIRAAGVRSERLYVYDGAKIDSDRYYGWSPERYRSEAEYGTESNPKVWVMREFKNSEGNHLGIPLPKGRVRFYRQDDDGQLEFTGEDAIDHTPRDETVRVYTGNAFDLVGERRRTNSKLNTLQNMLDESFEIEVRNHKAEPIEIRVVEHLYRWYTWEITQQSSAFADEHVGPELQDFTKMDARTIEFRMKLAPDAEEKITYTVHYTW
ncbi:MAG: hypothetical protein V2A79_02095 [Planctomycetota bacterium]